MTSLAFVPKRFGGLALGDEGNSVADAGDPVHFLTLCIKICLHQAMSKCLRVQNGVLTMLDTNGKITQFLAVLMASDKLAT